MRNWFKIVDIIYSDDRKFHGASQLDFLPDV